MRLRHLVLTATLAFASIGRAANRPNVVFVLTDDENIDTLGCYGANVVTPNIDSLARNGVKFTNANVVHTICSPSRYAMLTGRYYDNCTHKDFLAAYPRGKASCVTNFITLETDGMNIPGVLKKNGYTTGYVGKFHLMNHQLLGTTKGWEAGGLKTYPADADPRTDVDVNARIKRNYDWWCSDMKKRYGFDYVGGFYPANLRESFNKHLNSHNGAWTAEAATRFIRQQKGATKPFLLIVGTTYPHGPAPERFQNGKYVASIDADVQLTGEGYVTDRDLSNILPHDDYRALRQKNPKAPTAKWWDNAVGVILNSLRAIGQESNTIIIYTSDHGKLDSGKTTLYEKGIHVPLLIQWPQKIKPGVYKHVVGSIDLAPTIFDLCGIDKPEGYRVDGVSLKKPLLGSSEPVRDALFLEMGYAHGVKTDNWKYIAVRYSKTDETAINAGKTFKGHHGDPQMPQPYLILHKQLAQKSASKFPNYFARNQLYDLRNDILEKRNVYKTKPEVTAEMRKRLSEAMVTHLPHRPFGEFGAIGADDPVFRNVSQAIWYPASTQKLKIVSSKGKPAKGKRRHR